MDENYLKEEFLSEIFEEKTHINASNSWISCKQNDGTTYGIYVSSLYETMLIETTLKKAEKLGGKKR